MNESEGLQQESPLSLEESTDTVSNASSVASSSLHIDAGASAAAMKIECKTVQDDERDEKAREIAEIKRLIALKKKQAADISRQKSYIETLEKTGLDLEKKAKDVTNELASANERYISLEKSCLYRRYMFKDQCTKIQETRRSLKRHLQKDAQMRDAVEQKQQEFQVFMKEYMQRKSAASGTIDSINTQLAHARNEAKQQLKVLESKVKKEELNISTLKHQVEMKRQEKVALTKICEDLISHKQEGAC